MLIAPNIKFYTENCLELGLNSTSSVRVQEAMKCKEALVVSLDMCVCVCVVMDTDTHSCHIDSVGSHR